MKKFAMAVSILLMLGLAGASTYAFGTKVLPTDTDIGQQLFNLPVGGIRYWDTDLNAAFTGSDVLYLHIGAGATVAANDIRLTPFGALVAGSKVRPADNDIGQALTVLPSAFRFADLYGGPAYDLEDPVYVHQTTPLPPGLFTLVRDVRLTDVPAIGGFGLGPGTLLLDLEPDWNRLLGAPALAPNPLAAGPDGAVRYFDVNGNGVYDYPDDVYLNFPAGAPFTAPGAGHVTVNNVRLSGPVPP